MKEERRKMTSIQRSIRDPRAEPRSSAIIRAKRKEEGSLVERYEKWWPKEKGWNLVRRLDEGNCSRILKSQTMFRKKNKPDV